MKNCTTLTLATLAVCFCLGGRAVAQTTSFTYQGQLNDGATPASGLYDLTFALYDTNQPPGNLIAGPVTNSATAVSNGLFTTMIDFGAGVFTGTNYWLEIAVQTNGGSGFITLTPRQPLTPTPYAITAGSVVSGGLASGTYGNALTLDNADNNINGVFMGDGSGLTGVDAESLNGLTGTSFWQTDGNAGANPTNGVFIGTTDNLPLEFRVNGSRALRLEYTFDFATSSAVPNIIGGYSGNVISNGVVGGFIGGGGNAAYPNRVGTNYASVLGGLLNTASGVMSTAMGDGTTASGTAAAAMGAGTTAGGSASTAMGDYTTASGDVSTAMGAATTASGDYSTAMGCYSTASGKYATAMTTATASGDYSTAMGEYTKASGDFSTAMGSDTKASGSVSTAMGFSSAASGIASTAMGYNAQAAHDRSFVWSDGDSFSSTAPNQFMVHAKGGLQLFGGGLAVTGASSPNYAGAQGVFIESQGTYGSIFAFDYVNGHTLPLCLNSPGGNVGVGSTVPSHLFQVGNAYCDGNTWAPSSDRNVKAGFQPVDAQKVLAKVAALPITSWHYTNDAATPHVGPMAQDFFAAFHVGADDKHITTTDESGVALAAIQGLKEIMENEAHAKDARITTLEHELSEMKKLLTKLSQGKSEP